MLIRKVFNVIRSVLFLSAHDKMVRRFYRQGGEKLRYDYKLNEDSIVFDVGGYQGDWAEGIFSRYHCRVLVFEPVAEFAEKIRLRFRDNKMVEVFQFGLGGVSGPRAIRVAGDGSSMFRSLGETQSVRTEAAAGWIRERSFNVIDLMKINIEGAEYELLENLLEEGMVERMSNLQIQFHDVIPDAGRRMTAIQAALRKSHFLTYQYRFVWENWAIRQDIIAGGKVVN